MSPKSAKEPIHKLLALLNNKNRELTEEEQKRVDEFLESRKKRYSVVAITGGQVS